MSAAPTASPVAPGTLFAGKYRVNRVLYEGSTSVVVEADHVVLDERVALKVLRPEVARHPEAAARFLRAASAAVRLKSEHVARVMDVGTLDSGVPYVVLEYLQGRDLSGVLQADGMLPIADAVDYVLQACDALAEAHAVGMIHRALEPAHLFLCKRRNGTPLVKVLGFGSSEESGSVDHRTDVHALGITLYELLAGKPSHGTDTPTPIRRARPEVAESLAAVLEKAYTRDREQRWGSIGELVLALAPHAPPRSQTVIERVAKLRGTPL